jgi:hypothetical protein
MKSLTRKPTSRVQIFHVAASQKKITFMSSLQICINTSDRTRNYITGPVVGRNCNKNKKFKNFNYSLIFSSFWEKTANVEGIGTHGHTLNHQISYICQMKEKIINFNIIFFVQLPKQPLSKRTAQV